MKKHLPVLLLIPALALLALAPVSLRAEDQQSAPRIPNKARLPIILKYELITGFKQPFIDDLQLHLSNGWVPVGGVSVTSWNSNLYFAQLISKKTE